MRCRPGCLSLPVAGSSGLPGKSPKADPGEMLFLPLALLGQKAVGQRAEPPGRGLGQVDVGPRQRWGCGALLESRDRGAEHSWVGTARAAGMGHQPHQLPAGKLLLEPVKHLQPRSEQDRQKVSNAGKLAMWGDEFWEHK